MTLAPPPGGWTVPWYYISGEAPQDPMRPWHHHPRCLTEREPGGPGVYCTCREEARQDKVDWFRAGACPLKPWQIDEIYQRERANRGL